MQTWTVIEHRRAVRQLKRLPAAVLDRYEKWRDVVEVGGPQGLRRLPGLRDEALVGQWFGFLSSRLGVQYRVIYRVRVSADRGGRRGGQCA